VELALQIFDNLATKSALLVGAGEMAELAAKNLVDNGVGKLLVVNRSAGRAAGLAKRYGGTVEIRHRDQFYCCSSSRSKAGGRGDRYADAP